MFGIEEIENIVPPILTNIAWVRIYGEGLIFRIRETVIVSGIKIITVKILFNIAERNKVIRQKKIISKIGLAFDIFIRLIEINWNNPDSWAIWTINIIAKIKLILWKFTNPSLAVPNNKSKILLNLYCSKKIKTKKHTIAPAKEAIALFNFSVTIKRITEIKVITIKIVLIKIFNHLEFYIGRWLVLNSLKFLNLPHIKDIITHKK